MHALSRRGAMILALLRNVRFICASGMHAQGMKLAERERLLREQAFADAGNARQRAERGAYHPVYLNYTLGRLMIRKLRDDWTRDGGGHAARREFHDWYLSHGGPPLPKVRAAMLGNGAAALF
jgi:uncharacterized protein (DUF885 family)